MNHDIFQEGIKYLLSVETKFKKLVPKEEIKFFILWIMSVLVNLSIWRKVY